MKRLSYSALALFERCSYRYYVERVAGLREERGTVPGGTGLTATEIGDAVHRLLEIVDLSAPAPPDVELVRSWYPAVTDEEVERIAAFVDAYCESELAARIATLAGVQPERPFAFEHDGVLLHGRLDVLWRDGRRRSSSTTRRTRSRKGRPRRSSRPTTGCSGSSTRLRASAPAPTRSRSSTSSSSGPMPVVATFERSELRCSKPS